MQLRQYLNEKKEYNYAKFKKAADEILKVFNPKRLTGLSPWSNKKSIQKYVKLFDNEWKEFYAEWMDAWKESIEQEYEMASDKLTKNIITNYQEQQLKETFDHMFFEFYNDMFRKYISDLCWDAESDIDSLRKIYLNANPDTEWSDQLNSYSSADDFRLYIKLSSQIKQFISNNKMVTIKVKNFLNVDFGDYGSEGIENLLSGWFAFSYSLLKILKENGK